MDSTAVFTIMSRAGPRLWDRQEALISEGEWRGEVGETQRLRCQPIRMSRLESDDRERSKSSWTEIDHVSLLIFNQAPLDALSQVPCWTLSKHERHERKGNQPGWRPSTLFFLKSAGFFGVLRVHAANARIRTRPDSVDTDKTSTSAVVLSDFSD
ncbi:hypothetical protein DPEC_G00242670 [Dallia pectoralis]|uniref:Uncharacterized protein n=1 Tax=Dallia pectoralis TaxID=75939 RepID=A0ACC2FV82_DALPE|nr:hypothetical protein DPEC_G00242670 [Dallia pectoralis]